MAKADMAIARRYAKLVPDAALAERIYGAIPRGVGPNPATPSCRSPATTTCWAASPSWTG